MKEYLGAIAQLVACHLRKQREPLRPAHSFCGKNPLFADSRRSSCQFLVKELALNTGKLPGGEVVK